MQGMRKAVRSGIVILICLFSSSCAISYQLYLDDMVTGKAFLAQEEYREAEEYFGKAYKRQMDGASLTYLAIADYKTNNLERAEKRIRDAEQLGVSDPYTLRNLGYKALILLRKDRKAGLEALGDYLSLYKYREPLKTIDDVKRMQKTGQVHMETLERLIDWQVSWYEEEAEQFRSTATGFYSTMSGLQTVP
jgi:hypothetical protein